MDGGFDMSLAEYGDLWLKGSGSRSAELQMHHESPEGKRCPNDDLGKHERSCPRNSTAGLETKDRELDVWKETTSKERRSPSS